ALPIALDAGVEPNAHQTCERRRAGSSLGVSVSRSCRKRGCLKKCAHQLRECPPRNPRSRPGFVFTAAGCLRLGSPVRWIESRARGKFFCKGQRFMAAPTYEKLTPPTQGTRVTVDPSGRWNIPDDPVVCLLRGDGIGQDVGSSPGITTCAVRVLDAAV